MAKSARRPRRKTTSRRRRQARIAELRRTPAGKRHTKRRAEYVAGRYAGRRYWRLGSAGRGRGKSGASGSAVLDAGRALGGGPKGGRY